MGRRSVVWGKKVWCVSEDWNETGGGIGKWYLRWT